MHAGCKVGKLGDMKAVVRGEAAAVLLALMASLGCVDVLGRPGLDWQHRSWRVRQGILQLAAEAVNHLAAADMQPRQRNDLLLRPAVACLDDADKYAFPYLHAASETVLLLQPAVACLDDADAYTSPCGHA